MNVVLTKRWGVDVRNERRAPGRLGYIGDEKLPMYIGIIS